MKSILKRFGRVQLRARERAKSLTFFISYSADGRQHQEILTRVPKHNREAQREALAACEEIARKRDAELSQGVAGAEYLHAKNKNFLHFFEQVTATKKTPKIYRTAILKLKAFLATRNQTALLFAELTKAFCIDYREYLSSLVDLEHLSGTTAGKYWEAFRHIINEAVRRELLLRNPCIGIKAIAKDTVEREFLTGAELRRLVATPYPPTLKYDAELYAAYFLTICFTGVRPGDARRLCWSNIQTTDGQNFFLAFVPSKTKAKSPQPLVIPLHSEVIALLRKVKARQAVFSSENKIFQGLPAETAKNTVNNFIAKWIAKAGITKRITLYSARHSFASNLILNGVGLFETSRLLGHSTVKHTQVYSHLTDEARRNAIDKLPMLDGGERAAE